jgi:nucleoside-diphosphate-sugar epimerase
VPKLVDAGHTVQVMTRRPRAAGGAESVEADLATGAGISEAVSGIEVVVHLASAPYRGRYTVRIDVDGTGRLLTAASQAVVRHLLFISNVGIDRLPWGYFRRKLAAEQVVLDGSVPWSVLRPPSFTRSWTARRAQPVDPRDVADAIVARVAAGLSASTEEFCGPEVLHFD